MLVRCVHCHEPTDVPDDSDFSNIVCSCCGSSFSLIGEPTVTYAAETVRKLGRFELIEQVGAGAVGAVWKARDTELDRTVAVKIPRKEKLNAKEAEQFFREARAAAQLRHPNIVSVHEVGRHDDTVYIVSDFVQGATLDGWLTGQRLTPREAATLCAKIADALEHAHEHGVIHRDLKPGNIMLDPRGEPLLTDFGLARRQRGEVTMTIEGRILGTPAYMSPEQARGEAHHADCRTDIYSLGVILFRLLTDELPFRGNRDMLMLQIINEEAPSPRRLNARVPRDLETICLKCLQKNPDRRYGTAAELAEELRRLLRGEPIRAKPAGLLDRTIKWIRRRPAVTALLVVSFVAALALVGGGVGLIYNLQLQHAFHQVDEARATSEDALRQARIHLYFQRIAQADREWWANNVGRAEELLDDCPRDLRGWEWYYLKRLCHAELRTLRGHSSIVYCVAYSPDGRQIASGALDGTVRVWHADTGRELHTLRAGGQDWIADVAYSPDGRLLAAASTRPGDLAAKAKVILWDAVSGREMRNIPTSQAVFAVGFSPDGRLLAWSTWDGAITLWDLQSGKAVRTLEHGDMVGCLTFSPDGRYLACATGTSDSRAAYKPGVIKLWAVATGDEYRTLQGHSAPVAGIAFSPDGGRLVSSSFDQTIKIWNAATGDEVMTLRGHTKEVEEVEYNPDGDRIVSASMDGTVKVWDAASGRELLTMRGHTASVQSAAFSPDGRYLASCSNDQTVKVWDANRNPVRRVLHAPTRALTGVAFSPDQARLASTSLDGSIQLWDLATGKELQSVQGHNARAWTVSFSPDGRRIATASEDSTVKVWDATSGQLIATCMGHELWVQGAAFSPDGKLVASAGGDMTVKLWDPNTGNVLRTLRGHTARVWSVAFSQDGQYLASAGGDKTVRVWLTGTGEEFRSLGEHNDEVTSVAFSPGGQLLAATCYDGTMALWQVGSGQKLHTLRGHTGVIYAVAFSPNGRRLASAGGDTFVKLWDTATGEESLTLRGHSANVLGLAFSPDGHLIATASMDQTIGVWDATPLAGIAR